jgi:hypothetical protein
MARQQEKVAMRLLADDDGSVVDGSSMAAIPFEDALASRRRRLGTALHRLAMDLARERRRTAQLERELARVRSGRPHRPTSEDAA